MSDLLQPTRETSPTEQAPFGRATQPARRLWLAGILAAIVVTGVLGYTVNRNPAGVQVIGDTRAEAIAEYRAAGGGGTVEPIRDDRTEAIAEHREGLDR